MNGYYIVPSFGLMVTDWKTNKKIFFTGDTQFCPNQIMDFYEQADLIIQDCEYLYFDGKAVKSGVHAHYEDLKTLPNEIKAKMILSHYQDGMDCFPIEYDGFSRLAKKGGAITI